VAKVPPIACGEASEVWMVPMFSFTSAGGILDRLRLYGFLALHVYCIKCLVIDLAAF